MKTILIVGTITAMSFVLTKFMLRDASTTIAADNAMAAVVALIVFGFLLYFMPRYRRPMNLHPTPAHALNAGGNDGTAGRSRDNARAHSTNPGVFVIHGSDENARNAVVAFIGQLGLSPIVLRDQPKKGRTIIEQLSEHLHVDFAVAILTPDDMARPARAEISVLRARARQNVIFELGLFIGALGRSRVCALVKGDLEWPSDYDGILFHELDSGAEWKYTLSMEFESAGLLRPPRRDIAP